MFIEFEDPRRVAAERHARETVETLCQRAPTEVLEFVSRLLEHVCRKVLARQQQGAQRAA